MKVEEEFKPFIGAEKTPRELTVRAVILGIILGLFFNISNTYLGLKVGMTISASVPAAVLSIAILRIFFKDVSILENNIVQTIATVGEALASGLIFTIPALFLLGESISKFKIFTLAFFGGLLGILFMIPMRRYIIVKEHKTLTFPEGTACAEMLKSGALAACNATIALVGIVIGALYKICADVFRLWDVLAVFVIKSFENTQLRVEGTPSLLGVGFIIGYKTSATMFAGGVIGWFILIPLIKMYGTGTTLFSPSTLPIIQMSTTDIWSNYVRYIGAGAVAVGGIYNLIKIIMMIFKTISIDTKSLFRGLKSNILRERTDTDISMVWLAIGVVVVILLLYLLPYMKINFLSIIIIAVLGFIFSAVTSITVGFVGSSSNPASGLVLTGLLITGFIFLWLGWTERLYLIMALTVSALLNVIICLASTTSQDLNTGYIIGATPKKQQLAEIIGLFLPSAIIGIVMILLNKAYHFGSTFLPAPQATLMMVVSEAIIENNFPVVLVVFGIVLGVALLFVGVSVLPFAIGLYLPLETTTAIMIGGITRYMINKINNSKECENRGVLVASGLIAGDAVVGVAVAALTIFGVMKSNTPYLLSSLWGLLFFAFLAITFAVISTYKNNCKK